MVTHNVAAPFGIHAALDLLAHADRADCDRSVMNDQARQRALGVFDAHLAARPDQHAGVADLAAALGVERCVVEDDLHRLALVCRTHSIATGHYRQHAALVDTTGVAAELTRRQVHLGPNLGLGAALELGSGAAAAALLFQRC